jgi:hypothetical protein
LLVAACHTPRAPDLQGAPARLLESEIVRGTAFHRPLALRKCLFVFNHSGQTVAVFVDGRQAGWLGPRSSAAFFVGRSAGTKALLRATSARGEWRGTIQGPVWEWSWHLPKWHPSRPPRWGFPSRSSAR